jgi:hypothetical protein
MPLGDYSNHLMPQQYITSADAASIYRRRCIAMSIPQQFVQQAVGAVGDLRAPATLIIIAYKSIFWWSRQRQFDIL